MKKLFFAAFLMVLSIQVSVSQGISDISLQRINDEAAKDDGVIDFDNPKTYIGTPYNNPKFVLGSIYRNDSLIFNMVGIRYNAISDQIEIKESLSTPKEEIRNLKKSAALVAKIGKTKFVFMPYDGEVSKGDFLEVIYDGAQVDIYKKHVKDVRYPIKASSSITRDLPAKFTDKPLYFLVTRKLQFYQFPKARKKKFKIFGKKEALMKSYAKENKLDANVEEDLIAIVSHYEKQ